MEELNTDDIIVIERCWGDINYKYELRLNYILVNKNLTQIKQIVKKLLVEDETNIEYFAHKCEYLKELSKEHDKKLYNKMCKVLEFLERWL